MVARSLEMQLATLPGLAAITSRSDQEGVVVSLLGSDADALQDGAMDALGEIRSAIPEDTDPPRVTVVDPEAGLGFVAVRLLDDVNVEQAGFGGVVRHAAQGVSGVISAIEIGSRALQIEVSVDPARLHRMGLTLPEFVEQLETALARSPASKPEEIGEIALDLPNTTKVPVSAIASMRVDVQPGALVRDGEYRAFALAVSAKEPMLAAHQANEAVEGLGLPESVSPHAVGPLASGCAQPTLDERETERLAYVAAWLPADTESDDAMILADRVLDDLASKTLVLVDAPSLFHLPTDEPQLQLVLPPEFAELVLDRLRSTPGVVAHTPFAPGVVRIQARLQHDSLEVLGKASRTLAESLAGEGLTTLPASAPQADVTVSVTERARALGVTEHDVVQAYRSARLGHTVGKINRGLRGAPIVVTVPQPVELAELLVPVPSGEPVALAELVAVDRTHVPSRVLRRDQQRAELVVVLTTDAEASAARRKVEAALEPLRASTPGLTAKLVPALAR